MEYANNHEQAEETPLNREALVGRLKEQGVDIEIADWEGDDDNEVLGKIAEIGALYDIDIDELFINVDVPIIGRQDKFGVYDYEISRGYEIGQENEDEI